MTPRLKYIGATLGLFLLAAGIGAGCLLVVWSNAGNQDRAALERLAAENVNIAIFAALLLLAGVAWVVHLFFKAYVFAAVEVNDEARITLTADSAHRVDLKGAAEIRLIARDINALADRYTGLLADVEARIREANADVAAERNRLAALMSDLAQSVIVCNGEGRILLYNSSARQLFSQVAAGQLLASGLVGLGRSIFGIIDHNLIVHALETIHRRLEQGEPNPVAPFVTTAPTGQLIRGHLAPVRGQHDTIDGFVLTVEDITRLVESDSQRDALLQSLLEISRSGLANIRAAVETVLDYPEMAATRRQQLVEIIEEETVRLSARLDQTQSAFAESLNTSWLLEDMLGVDLVTAIQRRIEQKLGLAAPVEMLEDGLWLKVDSFAIVQALLCIAHRLQKELGITGMALALSAAGRFARLDVTWHGAPLDAEMLQAWQHRPLMVDDEGSPLTLRDIVDRHSAEIWSGADKATRAAYVRLLLPVVSPEPAWSMPVVDESRPEYYDFDLFHQPGQRPELDEQPLTELAYTVFDTETTGLFPSEGDEIISIGAVRIVNGRLLRHEVFDQLVDPRRPVSEESIRVHGITPRLLRGQPTIEPVLPLFVRFVEDTVLVAHNAAFDLRFFQLKQAQTGVALTQPVLDTLLLAQVAQPSQPEHSLEALARRLGVNVIGRHTALGDAIVTGEVFLKLIPLLAGQGIRTLKEAREAAERTYYARMKY
jgi:DNA polymerase-3 subunit epsilon